MKKRRGMIIMVLALLPFVALACWLVSIEHVIPGAIIFVLAVTAGNLYTLRYYKKNTKVAEK